MRIVMDLDGVIRDLNEYLQTKHGIPYPTEWNWKHKGKDVYHWIEEDMDVLLNAPPTVYYPTILKMWSRKDREVWTSQPKAWRPNTTQWIKQYLGTNCKIRFFNSSEEKEKGLTEDKNVILIEDCPKFKNYDRIILIDTSYNKNTEAEVRVCNPKQLELVFKEAKKYMLEE